MWRVPGELPGLKWSIIAPPTLFMRALRLPIIASGGLRDGIDIAKSIALGATLGGIAGPFLKAADESVEAVDQLIRELTAQLRIAMLCTGADSIPALQTVELIEAEDQNS
jgi:isopentenyl-diphosphate delta-isomerase